MGALYFGSHQGTNLADATVQSLEPSLDQIASALIGPDLLRLLGLRLGVDRGEALERSWAMRLRTPSDAVTLRAWTEKASRFALREAAATPFPAFLFNTTIAETGQPMAFATTQFPTEKYRTSFAIARQYPVAESASRVFNLSADAASTRDIGLEAATAARLSAGFPYVSPATTLDLPGGPRYHMVDGGYYDNYGLVALSQWLDDALEEMTSPPADVSVIIVRGLVESDSELARELQQQDQTPEQEAIRQVQAPGTKVPGRGWAWQVIAPPSAFLKTRGFGQWAGDNQTLKLLIEKWGKRSVAIHPHLFDFPVGLLPPACRVAPLSWKLSLTQQGCIEQGWAPYGNSAARVWRGLALAR
jgi:hypothetical protein